jgi:hypothetical protein
MPPPNPPDSWVKFSIISVNIQDKFLNYFKPYSTINPNLFEVTLADVIKNPFAPNEFRITHPISYNQDDQTIRLEGLDKDIYYTYRVNRDTENVVADDKDENVLLINLYDFYQTVFYELSGNLKIPLLSFSSNDPYYINPNNYKELIIRTNTSNDLTLKYDIQGNSVAEIVFDINKNIIELPHNTPNKAFNYFAEWIELLHFNNSNTNVDNMLNIIIMGDGFLKDDMNLYEIYANDLTNSLNENNFFKSHLDKINIYRLNTISNNKNIIGVDYYSAPFGDFDRIRKIISTSFAGGPLYLNSKESNIDAIVIVTKSTSYNRSYTQTYDGNMSSKNGQPVNIIVAAALNAKLPHLLGHALARLQDEYWGACNFLSTNDDSFPYFNHYEIKYRNISRISEGIKKWQRFMDLGYPVWKESNGIVTKNGLGTSDKPIKKTIYNDSDMYNVPTYYSVMGEKDASKITQFGPVNFYHLEASFRIRTGQITGANNIMEPHYDGSRNYEWNGYSINNFYSQYPPLYFEND